MTYCTCVVSCIKEFIMSLEKKSEGDMYKEQASKNPPPDGDGGGANGHLDNGATGVHDKPNRKVIHFSDGSTMEDYDDDDEDSGKNPGTNSDSVDDVEGTIRSAHIQDSQSAPPVDPSKLSWPEWMRHYSSRAGSKTLTVLEGMGGTAAYYLGITTPKYQSEIDEYNRMVAKKKSHEEELVSWSTGPKSQQKEPVVDEVRKNENGDIEMTEK